MCLEAVRSRCPDSNTLLTVIVVGDDRNHSALSVNDLLQQ